MRRRWLAGFVLVAALWFSHPPLARASGGDFAIGDNAEKEACRTVTRFDAPKGGGAADIYCGAWDNPSGRVILYPSEASAQAALANVCAGAPTPLENQQFEGLTQIACARGEQTGPTRYALVARRGGRVVIGEVYPADWTPLLDAARVLTGIAPEAAVAAGFGGSTPGLREIQAVFPDGPPGQAAEANYELVLRRAYEYNTIWSFDAAEHDFEALLAAHNKIVPDDTSGEAEIFADIALNMSNAGRFAEADDAFAKADGLIRQPHDALLASKILNYRALDRLNHRDYVGGLALTLRANQARTEVESGGRSSSGTKISAGDVGRVERGQTGANGDRTLLVALVQSSSADRINILNAQGDYIAAIATRSLGRSGEEPFLAAAAGELDKVINPPGWLVEDIADEQANSRFVAGDFAGSAAAAQAGLALIKTTEPGSRAEAHLWFSLEQAQAALGRTDDALASGRKAVAIFDQQTEQPGMSADIAAPHLALLETLWRQSNDPKMAEEFFLVMSLVWDSSAARTSAQLAARMALGKSGGQARAFQDAERAYRAALARQQLLSQTTNPPADKLAAAEIAARAATKRLAAAETLLRANAPSYLELLNPQASAADLQGVLSAGEAYLRIVMGARGGYGVLVSASGVRPYRIALKGPEAEGLADRIRRTTRLRGKALPDFDLDASLGLYNAVIGPVADRLAEVKDLDVDVSGPLASVPFAALLEQAPDTARLANIKQDQDYSGLSWLGRRVAVSNALGPAALIRLRKAASPAVAAPKAVLYGDYAPDPHAVAVRLAAEKGLSDKCQADVEHALTLLGPLPETADEVQSVAAVFTGARTVVGPAFTDTDVLTNRDTENADIIMLATHGVLGLTSCIPEPALLTSLGEKGNGLIEASQLLDHGLRAQLVVLSACDTAAGGRLDEASGGLGDGGDALSGLARGFIYAGASNVLVTQWKVDAATSSAQVVAFLGLANQPGARLGPALAAAQRTLFDQAETAHPFYWAAFIVVGDGERQLNGGSTSRADIAGPQLAVR
jgi:CHAT domain-containing protein